MRRPLPRLCMRILRARRQLHRMPPIHLVSRGIIVRLRAIHTRTVCRRSTIRTMRIRGPLLDAQPSGSARLAPPPPEEREADDGQAGEPADDGARDPGFAAGGVGRGVGGVWVGAGGRGAGRGIAGSAEDGVGCGRRVDDDVCAVLQVAVVVAGGQARVEAHADTTLVASCAAVHTRGYILRVQHGEIRARVDLPAVQFEVLVALGRIRFRGWAGPVHRVDLRNGCGVDDAVLRVGIGEGARKPIL